MNTEMTTRETELERQLSHIIKECEASSTQSKRIQRIKARAEAAINGRDPDFKSVGDRRDNKIAHIGQLNIMNTQLKSTIATLELEVVRLRSVMADVIKAHGYAGGTPVEVISTPFTPTALPELIEKVEKMTIGRCAEKLLSIGALGDGDFLAAIRAIPNVTLEELL